jgi:putative membrane protein
MKIPQLIAAEFRRLTASKMGRLALIALGIVPWLYGGLYLWANQNPDGALGNVPAAVVVQDAGTVVNGEHTNYGAKVAQQVVGSNSFQWHEVSASAAKKGVDNGTYDFSITFPENFSSALASASGSDPQKAQLSLNTNDTNSYLVSTIAQQAATTIKAGVVATVNEQAAKQLLLGLSSIRGSLVTATGGAAQLLDGATAAQSGATQLSTGIDQLASGSATLSSGLDSLRNQTANLPAQTRQLSAGASQVAQGDAALAQQADKVGTDAQNAVNQLPQIQQDILNTLSAQGFTADQIAQVKAQLDTLAQPAQNINTQVQSTVQQIDQLSSGASQVSAGAAQLADNTPALADGISQAAAGADQLASGAAQAGPGAAQLATGVGSLKDGLTTLHSGLATGVKQIPDSSKELRASQAHTIANPVDLKDSAVTSAGSYGAGLAPFFVALAAWIGIYALFLIVKPFSRRAVTALRSPIKITLAGWLTPGLLGAAQMVGLIGIVTLLLRFPVQDPLAMYGLMALASLSYTAIIAALNIWFGSVGQFLGLILMVVQLVTAGGTFPWQTLPAPLAVLHHVLPMSFAVDGLRQAMYGGSAAQDWADAGGLAVWGVICLLLCVIGVRRMTSHRTLRDLQPSLIG